MMEALVFILKFLFDNWWILLPFLFWQIIWEKYKSYKRVLFLKKRQYDYIELKFPENITKTPKAMEEVINSLHGIAPDPIKDTNWLNLNIYGFVPRSYTFLIVAHDSKLRFFIRFPKELKDLIKSRIYSQYPEVKLIDTSDIMSLLPPAIPNSLFNCEIFDVRLSKEDSYPIRTYNYFESLSKEQQIDILSTFSEAAWKISNKEWIIFQMFVLPVTAEDEEYAKKWVERGNKLINKLIGKKEEEKESILEEIEEFIINLLLAPFREPVWKTKEEKSKEEFNIQKLTPGERETIQLIHNKISKLGFWCNIRVAYIATNDIFNENKESRIFLIKSILKNFGQENINSFEVNPLTLPSIKFSERRIFLIKRSAFYIFRNYLPTKLPNILVKKFKLKNLDKGFILNSEELASLFHPPMKVIPPIGIERLPFKDIPPSSELPLI